ncbi:MAG: glycerol-3-phosphate 1-O-acyltransferase PlsY [candidate division KSB1 bacterium]|nr:glycerol-3-phosphate 1-O-acyltransferase PlsY [candidate division KSB1 bacterium]MDZ7347067.1 glycerol-3-phosphate 1-O-acyltransferase PlsY [candidate division KSB1 bacterium]
MKIFVMILLSYLVGSFPTSIIVGKLLRGIDIREHGSGNAGGTNVFRVLGPGPGIFVMAFDVFKGFAATFWISRFAAGTLDSGLLMLMAGCAAIIGHIWTVFAGFRGGKGVGTAAGMMLALYPAALGICLLVFLLVFLLTRIVSVSSMSGAVALPIVLTIFRYVLHIPVKNSLYLFSFFAAALIIFTHRSNIKRLLNGTENRFGKKKA